MFTACACAALDPTPLLLMIIQTLCCILTFTPEHFKEMVASTYKDGKQYGYHESNFNLFQLACVWS